MNTNRTHVMFFLTLLTAATVSQANIIHVPDDQPTVAEGLLASSAGDTVSIASGTYDVGSGLNMRTDNVTMMGAGPATVLQGDGTGSVVFFRANGLVLEDLVIQGGVNGVVTDWDILNGTIRRCIIRNNTTRGIFIEISYVRIESTEVCDNGGVGILAKGYVYMKCYEAHVIDCSVHDNGGTGIVSSSASVRVEDSSVVDNAGFAFTTFSGIDPNSYHGTAMLVYDSVISGNNPGGDQDGQTVQYPIILHCCDYAPERWTDSGLVVDDSECNVAQESSSWSDLKRAYR